MSDHKNQESPQRTVFLNCLSVAACVTVFFIVTLSLLLLFQQSQLNSASPLDFKELEKMKETARTDGSNLELRKEIRHLDLMSRRGFFLGQEWRNSAIKLLLGGIVFLLVCMTLLSTLKPVQVDREMVKPDKRSPGSDVFALLIVASGCVVSVNGFLLFTSAGSRIEEKSGAVVETREITREEFKRNWPSFRGPDNTGVSFLQQPVCGWASEPQKGIRWKTEIPLPGYSSPIVWGNRLFITGGDAFRRTLFCYDADSGKLLWTHEATGIRGSPAVAPEVSKDTGYAASTPATDGNRVFAIFATGDLFAVDLNGRRVWAKNLGVPKNMYGYCSSLLVVRNRLIVQYDNEEQQILFCFDTATGNPVWQQERKTMVSWSSPTLCEWGGKELMIITLTCTEVEAFDLSTGKKEWAQKIMGGEVAPSPTCRGNTVFVANDNALAAAIDASTGKVLWKNDKVMLPDVCSPVVFEDMLFLFTSASSISCLDTASGTLLWEKNVEQGFYSSPLLLKDRIMAFDLKGNMLIIKPDRAGFIMERQEPFGESVLTTPAIVGNRMWVRGATSLFALEGTEQKNVGK